MNSLNQFLADFPSTNGKSALGLLVSTFTVLVLLGGLILGRPMNETITGMVLGFNATWMGFSVAQFSIKRKTELVTPPTTMADNAAPTVMATDAKPPEA